MHVSLVEEPSGALLTVRRDKTGRMWYEDVGPSLINIVILNTRYLHEDKGHTKYLSRATYQEPIEAFPSGLDFTRCQDGKVRAFLPDIKDPLFQLDGHVCREVSSSSYLLVTVSLNIC